MDKKCSKCKKILPLSEFGKNSKSKDGLKFRCKKCRRRDFNDYRKTKKGVISAIYKSQREKSKERGHPQPEYSKNEITDWLLNNRDFNRIYENWLSCGCNKWDKPSIDRVSSLKPYRWDNIRVVTMRQQLELQSYEVKSGKDSRSLKAVISTDKDGNETFYHSIRDASRKTGGSPYAISCCCRNIPKYYTSKGFKWRYAK